MLSVCGSEIPGDHQVNSHVKSEFPWAPFCTARFPHPAPCPLRPPAAVPVTATHHLNVHRGDTAPRARRLLGTLLEVWKVSTVMEHVTPTQLSLSGHPSSLGRAGLANGTSYGEDPCKPGRASTPLRMPESDTHAFTRPRTHAETAPSQAPEPHRSRCHVPPSLEGSGKPPPSAAAVRELPPPQFLANMTTGGGLEIV